MDITKVRDPKRTAYPPLRKEDLYSGQGGEDGLTLDSWLKGLYYFVNQVPTE